MDWQTFKVPQEVAVALCAIHDIAKDAGEKAKAAGQDPEQAYNAVWMAARDSVMPVKQPEGA